MAATLAAPPSGRKAAPGAVRPPVAFRQSIVMIGKQGEKTPAATPCRHLTGAGAAHIIRPSRSRPCGALASRPGYGAVAQLGERRVRNAEVRSSILLGSTIPFSTSVSCAPDSPGDDGCAQTKRRGSLCRAFVLVPLEELHPHFLVFAEIGRFAGHGGGGHFQRRDHRAGAVPIFGVERRHFQQADVGIVGAFPPGLRAHRP